MQSETSQDEHRTVYVPPADDVIDSFAEQVCRALGPGYNEMEVVDGLSAFFKAASKAYANILTRDGIAPVDTRIKPL